MDHASIHTNIHTSPVPMKVLLNGCVFVYGYLCLIGVWLGDDQRTNTMKTHVRRRLDYAFRFY
jgi:hypothetical protein